MLRCTRVRHRWWRAVPTGCLSTFAPKSLSTTADQHKSNDAFSKILVANRGEIACRVIQTARSMGLRTVAVYSDADVDALHVALADEAVRIGPSPAVDSYLRGDVILGAAKRSGAQALHPGYGFLSENAEFARSCASEGIVFVGPPASAIDAMGSKSVAKTIMSEAGVPVCPGYHGDDQSEPLLEEEAKKVGYPLMIKAVMGGGGKGMRLVTSAEQFKGALEACRREATAGFADERMLLERFITEPRHVEVQVFADTFGNFVHLFERDCSVQRRHQKVLEEAPAPGIDEATRADLGAAAVRAARAVEYIGAGTVEFLMDTKTQEFFFCEMNTRLQDLVEWQLRVAAGQELPVKEQADISLFGHAVEARICAENVSRGFLPAAGTLRRMRLPSGVEDAGASRGGVKTRVDTGVREGDAVSMHYDPMIAKLIVHAETRKKALVGLQQALMGFQVIGLPTNMDFCERVAGHEAFARGGVTTAFLDEHGHEVMPAPVESPPPAHALVLAATLVLLQERAALITADDTGPWSPMMGPWRVVGVRKERLLFGPNKSTPDHKWTDDLPSSPEAGEERADTAGIEVDVECLADGGYLVDVRGTRYTVEAAVLGEGGRLTSTIDGRRYSVDGVVENWGELGGSGQVTLWCCHGPMEGDKLSRHRHAMSVMRRRSRDLRASTNTIASTGELASPMPGRVIRVKAVTGEEVVAGQELVILEAMKMEHAILAPSAGIVDVIHFEEGNLVDEGAVLVTIRVPASEGHA